MAPAYWLLIIFLLSQPANSRIVHGRMSLYRLTSATVNTQARSPSEQHM